MKSTHIMPTRCAVDCPFYRAGEVRGVPFFECKFYEKSDISPPLTPSGKFDFCKVEGIIIMEKED